ncbi:L-ascorbate metabolism protein UlaG, beta-lactamase superfamily [Amycolatopsis pretoriensis]|uniref:L-ascorbate metabolism protein UlaG, beta-lactamase superfamily n=1 Tax=Amycolatopsis pretoriensis TaxID=218821 RepID=A0A1H5RDM3_9PSEU|nr:MBL fold metallo-hydrolase [Amycolatopsis pretoriensis]SEF36450.1 L-ascorbate metabolism protein UlaG, beta-lactamase superfamily [Amycolatopsis pretoriensis]
MSGFNLRFLGHSTVRLELADRVVLTDPVLTARVGGLVRVVPPPPPDAYAGVDLVLLSHLHGDHLHLPSLKLLGTGTRIVVPRGAGAWLARKGFRNVEEIAPGETLAEGALTVTATEAVHSGHRWGPRLTHGPQSPAIGHLIEGAGTKVYNAGDTDLFAGMADFGPVDVALLPVWGWGPNLGPGHLDPARAAEAAGILRARAAVPVHWGTLAVPGLKRTARMRRLLADPPRVFAAEVKAAGGTTEVLFTEPGADVVLPAPTDRA